MTAEQIAKAVIGYRMVHKCTTAEALVAVQKLLARN
jgi:hypothetical protein